MLFWVALAAITFVVIVVGYGVALPLPDRATCTTLPADADPDLTEGT